MLIDSWKSALKKGIILGLMSFGAFLICMCFVGGTILRGESFFDDSFANEVNEVSLTAICLLFSVVASIVPIVSLRYTRVRFLPLALFAASLFYIFMSLIFDFVTVIFGIDLFEIINWHYLLDMMYFQTVIFAPGTFIGIIIAVFINTAMYVMKKRRQKEYHLSSNTVLKTFIIILLVIVTAISVLMLNPRRRFCVELKAEIDTLCGESGKCSIDFKNVVPFEFDRIIVFQATASDKEITEALGFKYKKDIPEARGIIFMRDGKIVFDNISTFEEERDIRYQTGQGDVSIYFNEVPCDKEITVEGACYGVGEQYIRE